jgi:hypothetical protein
MDENPLYSQLRLCTYNIFAWRTAQYKDNDLLVASFFKRIDADVHSLNEVCSFPLRCLIVSSCGLQGENYETIWVDFTLRLLDYSRTSEPHFRKSSIQNQSFSLH